MYKLCAVIQTHDPSTCIWEMEAEPEESILTWRPASLVNTGGKKREPISIGMEGENQLYVCAHTEQNSTVYIYENMLINPLFCVLLG